MAPIRGTNPIDSGKDAVHPPTRLTEDELVLLRQFFEVLEEQNPLKKQASHLRTNKELCLAAVKSSKSLLHFVLELVKNTPPNLLDIGGSVASPQTALNQDANPTFARVCSFDILKSRLEIINDSAKRARGALLLCILASGAMFLCLWNTYASWDRDFAFLDPKHDFRGFEIIKAETSKEADDILAKLRRGITSDKAWQGHKKSPVNEADILDEIKAKVPLFKTDGKVFDSDDILGEAWRKHAERLPQNLHDQQMRSWIDTQTVSVGLLGIKISVSDFALVGSMALFLCNYYLLLCTRRENHDIGYLFQDIDTTQDKDLKQFAYHAVATVSSLMVFNLMGSHSLGGGTDAPIDSLNTPNRKPKRLPKIPGIRRVSWALDFLPAATIFATIVCDIGWSKPWRVLEDRLFISPFRPPYESPFAGFDSSEIKYFLFVEIFAFATLVCLIIMSWNIRRYEDATRRLLDSVYKKLGKLGLEPKWVESIILSKKNPKQKIKLPKNAKLCIKCDPDPNKGKIKIEVDGQPWKCGDEAALAPGKQAEVTAGVNTKRVQVRMPQEQIEPSTGTYQYIEQES